LVGGVALQRGFWRESPGEPGSERGSWWPMVGGVLGGAALVGLASLWRNGARKLVVAAALTGLTGWLLGQGGAGMVGPLFRFFTDLPGMRIMREAGKFISLVSLAWAVGLGGFADMVARFLAGRSKAPAVAGATTILQDRPILSGPSGAVRRVGAGVALGLLPVLLTPGLAWGVGGRLKAVHYPKAWTVLAVELNRHPEGRVIVLPFRGYYNPGFTNGRVVKHPSRAFFGPRVLLSDDAEVEGLPPSEGTTQLDHALGSADPGISLARAGVGWVIGVADPAPISGRGIVRSFMSGQWAIYKMTTFSGESFPMP
jgi:hypothetical protein